MQQIDHRVIKLVVGIIAVSMAFIMQIASGEHLTSISEAYHYRARDMFVGLLFAVAAMFVSFKGENSLERRLTLLASLCAVLVAIAPCECGRSRTWLTAFHFPAAAGVFMIFGYFCWRFRRTAMAKISSRVLPLVTNPLERYHILECSAPEDHSIRGTDAAKT